MKTPAPFILIIFISLLVFSAIVSAQSATACNTGADQEPCDGFVDLTELQDYIQLWYGCSSCYPDLYDAVHAYIYYIEPSPECGDGSCNGNETCSSCPQDCGDCPAGNVYYVSIENPACDDNGPGNSTVPWCSFSRALPDDARSPKASEGDTVYVASGDYGQVTYNENGDTGRTEWITYIGAGATRPIIRHLGIGSTPNAYMKFDNFEIHEPVSGTPVRSIEILGTDVNTNRVSNIEFDNCYIEMAASLPLGYPVWMRYADNITFNNCEIVGGSKGLLVSKNGNHVKVNNCHFHDQWGDGLAVFANEAPHNITGITIENSLFEDLIAIQGVSGAADHMDYIQLGINAQGAGTVINDVIIRNTTFHFTLDPAWFDWVDLEMPDTFAYNGLMLQHAGNNFVYENNLIYGMSKNAGWLLNNVVNNVVVRNNTFAHSSYHGWVPHIDEFCTAVEHYNNIWYPGFQITAPPAEVNQGNNIYSSYSNVGGGHTGPPMDDSSFEIGEAGVDALFVDYVGGDFTPLTSSIACPEGNPNLGPEEYIGAIPCTGQATAECEVAADCPDPPECQTNKRCDNQSCVYDNLADGTKCTDDGLYCTGNEKCQSGQCLSSGDPCSANETCDENGARCLADPCLGITDCIHYSDMSNCTNDPCGVPGECAWNVSKLICEEATQVFPEDYISYWMFEDNVYDEAGTNNGTIIGDPQFITGQSGKALDLDGIDDHVRVDSFVGNVGDEATYTFWVNLKSNIEYSGFLTGTDSPSIHHRSPNNIRTHFYDTSSTKIIDLSCYQLGLDEWTFFAVTANSTNAVTYVNGAYCSQDSPDSPPPFMDIGTLYIGSNKGYANRYLNGSIDEVMIYNRSLTGQEIQQIYDAQK